MPGFNLEKMHKEIDAVYMPELPIDVAAEAARLRATMDAKDCANIFVSEAACVDAIVKETQSRGEETQRDAFGHVRLDEVNVGNWFPSNSPSS